MGQFLRGKGMPMGTKKIVVMKGPLNFPQDVARDGMKKVITKPIKGAKEARSNGSGIPARGGKWVGQGIINVPGV